MVAARPRLEQHRLANLAHPLEELEVLHVAGADLEYVHAVFQQRQVFGRHHLGHDRQPVAVAGLPEQFDAGLPQALKRVGGSARLEGAAAQPYGTRLPEQRRHLEDLLARLHRAGAGDYRQPGAAHLDRADGYLGFVALELARGELVGLAERDHLRHPGQQLHLAAIDRVSTYRPKHRLAVLAQLADLVAMGLEMFAHRAFLGLGDAAVEHDDHG